MLREVKGKVEEKPLESQPKFFHCMLLLQCNPFFRSRTAAGMTSFFAKKDNYTFGVAFCFFLEALLSGRGRQEG